MAKRVLYTAFDVLPAPKGASRHITAFTQGLLSAGHDVTLFTAGLPDMPAEGMYAGARILRYHSAEPNFLRRAVGFGDAVWQHLQKHGADYDVVHFRDIWSGGAALALTAEMGYATLFEANGLPSVELKYHYPALEKADLLLRLREQEMALLRQVDTLVCVSSITAIFLQSLGAPREKVHVIPNGVDPDLFAQSELPERAAPRLVYNGTLTRWQGVELLIQALPALLCVYPDLELHLVGPSKRRHQKGLEKLVARLGVESSVHFAGALDPQEVAGYIASASLCVAPLTYNDRNVAQGCCPIKVLEYAAVARPVLAADLPVLRELLREDEAYFFRPGDVDDLVRQTLALLAQPELAQARALRAAARVRATFPWERACARLNALYADLLAA